MTAIRGVCPIARGYCEVAPPSKKKAPPLRGGARDQRRLLEVGSEVPRNAAGRKQDRGHTLAVLPFLCRGPRH